MKKSIVSFVMASVIFMAGITNAGAEYEIGTIIASSLNVREHASSTSAIVAEVDAGSEVVILERTGDWYKVNVGDIGYVKASYVRTSSEVASGTVNSAPTTDVTISKGQQAVDIAKQYIGVRYVYGGTTPNGFDCSGFVQYVYRQMGVSINRVAADQANNGIYVEKENLQPGDLVFFKKPGRVIHHVGMYVGDGKYIHAPYTGRTICIEAMTRSDYYTARRIFY